MPLNHEERPTELNGQPYNRSKEIQDHVAALAGRDLHLFSILLGMLIVLSLGISAVAFPGVIVPSGVFRSDSGLLTRLLIGLIAMIALFTFYVTRQKKDLTSTRQRLIEELIFNERTEALSLIDPTTQLYNRKAMELMLAHEVARAMRHDSPLSLMVLNFHNYQALRNRLGTEESDFLLYEVGQLVRSTLRGSDLLFHYKQNRFLVAMPETPETKVEGVIQRLDTEFLRFNLELGAKGELGVSYGVAQHSPGFRITDALIEAERRVFFSSAAFSEKAYARN